MGKLIRLLLMLVIGFISIVAAALVGMGIAVFELLDMLLTPMIRKGKHKM
jgi:hypothetical protein